VNSLIGRVVPTILRHLEGYVEIAGEDAREATAFVARRLLALVVAGACAFVALLMTCAWLLVLAWETPWRAWTAAGLAVLFGAAAVALAWPAFRRATSPHALFFPRVRNELSRDRELIDRAFDGQEQPGNGREHRAN
jgi:uncharacterized membrane protein YqjE